MNTLRTSQWSWNARQVRCLVLCAAWLTGSAVGEELAVAPAPGAARIEMQRAKGHRSTAAQWGAMPTLPAAWSSLDLVPEPWRRSEINVLRRPVDLLAEDRDLVGASSFNTNNLFRTRKEVKYRDTLQLLLTKRQMRVWLREDLHMQCEVKRYRSLDEGRELGVKLGLYYRFQ